MKASFILWLLAVSSGLALLFYLLMPMLPEKVSYSGYIYVILFFAFATFVFHLGLSKSAIAGSKHFVRYYMMATGLKLLIYIAIIMFYAMINKPGVTGFAFTFLISYFTFTTFETVYSYKEFGFTKKSDLN